MSLFITEAAVLGSREAVKIALIWFAVSSFFHGRDRPSLVKHFFLGLVLATLLGAVSLVVPLTPAVREFITRLVKYVFFVIYVGSVLGLLSSPGWWTWLGSNRWAGMVTLTLTVFYFSPDILGASYLVRELAVMKEAAAAVYGSALAAFVLVLPSAVILLLRLRRRASGFFEAGQLLVFLLLVKMLAGGAEGISEFSLLPAVQRGSMKFIHDVVHQTFVFLLVPDHPMLQLTVWNFIGILFGPNAGLAAALALLLLPPVVFLYRSWTAPIPVPEDIISGAERRLHKAAARTERRMKALPVGGFVVVILVTWFAVQGSDVSTLYNPAAKPVIEDRGTVIIPLTDPTMDLRDGQLHKFSLLKDGETIGLLIILKPDGALAVCLDACEICPPDGYGQREGNVVCLYCMTPIPVEALGRAGGCNPIPLSARITDTDVRIPAEEITRKWRAVSAGETKREILK